MKIKELKSLKEKSLEELQILVAKKRSEVDKIVVKILESKEKNVRMAKGLRKEIAQILTLMKEKKL